MPRATLTHFVEKLCRSPILDPLQREEALRLSQSFPNPREFAQELLRRDWLTAYQANQIAQGKGDDLVLGQYVLLERLGEGGMGQVFKARQRNLDRIVAFKLIHPSCLENERVIQRFMREIRAAGQLSHPNIVRAYDADFIKGHWFIAMEFIDGGDLAREVRQRGPLPVIAACDYIRQAALGLQHAHERGMLHRDIKPANLLLTQHAEKPRISNPRLLRPNLDQSVLSRAKERSRPWGTVKILDLGLACLGASASGSIANLTQLNTVLGTPDYISPEQAFNPKSCDIRSDLYSLGCTFYFLLTGQPPFADGTLTEKLMHHQNDDPTTPAWVRATRMAAEAGDGAVADADAQVPSEVESVLRKLIAKKPEHRFQTPDQVAIVLEGVIEGLQKGTFKRPRQGATITLAPPPVAAPTPEPIEVEMRSASPLQFNSPLLQQPKTSKPTQRKHNSRDPRLILAGLAATAVAGALITFAASRRWPSHSDAAKALIHESKSK